MREQAEFSKKNVTYIVQKYLRNPAGFLEDILGMELDDWQREACADIIFHDRLAFSSGHSIGKTALSAGLIQWFIAVHPTPYIVATANTKQQLSEKTWRELAKWHDKSLIRSWFEWTATQFRMREMPATWFATAVPQTEHNSEAFAGIHEKFILQIFDESSNIPAIIFEVAEGATATEGGYRKWVIFGNPTRNTGAFYDACFGRQTHRWHNKVIDARNCKYADQEQIRAWAEDYGEDSDFFRVRVLGLPPEQSITTLIGQKDVDMAVARNLQEEAYRFAPKVLSVDVARYGDDETVICYRQGLKCHWFKSFRALDEMEIAQKVANEINDNNPQAVFFDVTGGYGAGAHDRLRQLKYSVTEVNFASRKGIEEHYQNMRMSMWDTMRQWISTGSIPDDKFLIQDLTTPEYTYNRLTGKKQLESKEDLKRPDRLGRSPDRGDALAISFAYPVQTEEPERFLTQAEKDWQHITGHDNQQTAWILD